MYLKCERDLFPQNNFNPPIGYYDIHSYNSSRKVDFSLKPTNMRKTSQDPQIPGPGSYLNTPKRLSLPYITPKLRRPYRDNTKNQKLSPSQPQPQPFYDVSLSYVKPRVQGGIIQKEKKEKEKEIEIEKDNQQSPQLNSFLNQFSLVGQSLNENEIVEYKEYIKDQLKQQKIAKKIQNNRLLFEDNLEQMLLRDKMQKITETPGPGYYQIDKMDKRRYKEIPQEYQCFDIREKRFKENNNGQIACIGLYEVQEKQTIRSINLKKQIGRQQDQININNPGVGEYNVQQRKFSSLNKDLEYPAVFGSGSKRF